MISMWDEDADAALAVLEEVPAHDQPWLVQRLYQLLAQPEGQRMVKRRRAELTEHLWLPRCLRLLRLSSQQARGTTTSPACSQLVPLKAQGKGSLRSHHPRKKSAPFGARRVQEYGVSQVGVRGVGVGVRDLAS